MIETLKSMSSLPKSFHLLVLLFAGSGIPVWMACTQLGGLGPWAAVAVTIGLHWLVLLLLLRLSCYVPRFRKTPSYTLDPRLSPYRGHCPPFEERSQFPDWAKSIEAQFPAMKAELDNAVRKQTEAWHEDSNRLLMTRPLAWQHLPDASTQCPKTFEVLNNTKGFRNHASFSKLSPHARIKEHAGESDIYYRCHLAFTIPGPLPKAGFSVNDDKRSWEEGKLLLFCDSYRHSAWNDYDVDRIVLLFDVIRPEFAQFEESFVKAYRYLVFVKTGVTGANTPLLLRPLFPWLCAVMVIYLNVFFHSTTQRSTEAAGAT